MKSAPFFGRIPQQFLKDAETRGFIEYLINYISDVQSDTAIHENTLLEQSSDLSTLDAFSLRSMNADTTSDAEFSYTSTPEQYRSVLLEDADTTAVSGDFIAAKGVCTITLDDSGSEGSRIKIVNLDGTAITIVGMIYNSGAMSEFEIDSIAVNAVYDFQFHVELNGWLMV